MRYGTGALPSGYDIRDYKYSPVARGGFDWDAGYDIEDVVGKIVTKDQGKSGSCGGQAWAYYGEVLETIATGSYEPRSARWIYAHTHVPPGGGSRGRDNCDFVKKRGWVREKIVPSYQDGKPPSETFITGAVTITKDIVEDVEISKAFSYLRIAASNIEQVATALVENHGVILMIAGKDNGTWRSTYPEPPIGDYEWLHWVYVGKAKKINGKKYIGIKNSWGKIGENGWQWISEDYFNSGNVIEGWTLSWDYTPAKHKLILKEVVSLLQKTVGLYKQLLIKKSTTP